MSVNTLQVHIRKDHPDFITAYTHCHEARRLRNGINAICRTDYFYRLKSEKLMWDIVEEYGVKDLVLQGKINKDSTALIYLVKTVVAHQDIDLPAKVSQSTARGLGNSWSSFFALRKKGMKTNIPGYSHKFHTAEYNKQCISTTGLKRNRVIPTGWKEGVVLPSHIRSDQVQTACVTAVNDDHFILNIRYINNDDHTDYTPTPGLMAGVDPGVNNLLTIAFSDFREGIIIDGRPMKEINSTYNWMISDLTSKLDMEKRHIENKINKGVKKTDDEYVKVYRPESKRLDELWCSRKLKLKHYYTTATNTVVRLLCEAGVETLVLGWNQGCKQNQGMGKRNNRKFTQIPMKEILLDLERKALTAGIKVVWTEESYTSKSSFIDNDPLPVYGDDVTGIVFSGRRVTRGEYKSASGVRINADLNGAYNVIRKHEHRFSITGVGGDGIVISDNDRTTIDAIGVVVSRCRRLIFLY